MTATTTHRALLAACTTALVAAATAPAIAQAAPTSGTDEARPAASAAPAQGTSAAPAKKKLDQRQGAEGYWTPERMRRAQDRTKTLPAKAHQGRTVEPKGAPTTIQGRQPVLRSNAESPRRTIGKVFFTLGGKDYVCSANSVTSANRSVVSTAGHCVNEGPGAYASRFIFVPAYQNGSAPYGRWAGITAYAPQEWSARGDINQDTAFVVVDKVNGRSLTDVVGATGVAFNQARGQRYTAFGYPASAPFDGETLRSCQGTAFKDPVAGPSRQSQGIDCDMTGGSSGGPWFLGSGYQETSSVQNSVNSYGYPRLGAYMFGPYWGTTIQQAYNGASADAGA